MDGYNHFPPKINSEALFAEFLEKNNEKIPEDVIVERVEPGHHVLQNNSGEGKLVIHAFALSLGLKLPLNPLISEILSIRGLDTSELVPNCWRIMFGILALNQYFCKIKLGWKEFYYCYVVKKNPAGLYYFSPRKKKYALVENLPNSEKGWQDVYISLKGNWGGARNENTSGEPAGANYSRSKPRDREVNFNDLDKAWSFENKDWTYLLNPANWRNDEAAVAGSSLLPEARGEVSNWRNDGAAVAGSSLLPETREEVTSKEVIISSLENTDNDVVEQGETGLVDDQMTNVSLSSFQPHSKKHRTNHDSGSGGVAHDDDHHIMNLESTPDHTRACGGQEAAHDLLSHFEKAIGKLSVDDETGLGLARSLVMVMMSFAESQDSKNKTINELEAKNERLEKELIESKSATCKEPVGAVTEHKKSSTAEQFESLTKTVEGLTSVLNKKTEDIEGLRSEIAQLKEMRSHGQINEQPNLYGDIDLTIFDYELNPPYHFM